MNNCKHLICNSGRITKSAGVAIINKTLLEEKAKYYVLLGRETAPHKQKKYNYAYGKLDEADNGCLVECARRELFEEFAIDISINEIYNQFNYDEIINNTVNTWPNGCIFIIFYRNSMNVGEAMKQLNFRRDSKENFKECELEIDDLRWVELPHSSNDLTNFVKKTKSAVLNAAKRISSEVFLRENVDNYLSYNIKSPSDS